MLRFFCLFAAVFCALFFVCGASYTASLSAEGKVLHIYNWAEYLPQTVIDKFTEETGIHVIYDVFESSEVLEAKIASGGSGYDVVFPSAFPDLTHQIPMGLYAPLDKSKIPNLAKLDPDCMKRMSEVDPGHIYSVPYLWGTTGFAYNADLVKKLLPDAPTDSLRMLFDPSVVKALSQAGVCLFDSAIEVFPMALIYLGLDPNKSTVNDLKKVEGLLKELQSYVQFSSYRFIEQLANQEVAVAHTFSSYGKLAVKRCEEVSALGKSAVHYVVPKEGGFFWVDVMAIPRDAPHKDHAHNFINFILRPEIMAEITNKLYLANAVLGSGPFLDPKVRQDPAVYPPQHVLKRLFLEGKKSSHYQKSRARLWMKVKTGF